MSTDILNTRLDSFPIADEGPTPRIWPADEVAIAMKESGLQTVAKRRDPLVFLPEEVWTPIIAESAKQIYLSSQVIVSQDALLDLTLVSSLWNIKISSNAVLWVDIILEDQEDAAAKAALALYYSKEAPIALYMYETIGWWDALRERLVANRGRINKIYIGTDRSASIVPIIQQLSPLPNLKALRYKRLAHISHDDNFRHFFDSPIEWLDNLWLDKDILQRRGTRELRRMYISDDLDEVMNLLEDSECLQEVYVPIRVSSEPIAATGAERKTQAGDKKLPWKSLQWVDWPLGFGSIAATIGRLSALVKLVIGISQNEFCYILPLIHQLTSLQNLVMAFPCQWVDFRRPVVRQPAESVRSLCLDFTVWTTVEIGERLEDILFQCFPNVRYLNVYALTIAAISTYASTSGFQYVKDLIVNSWASGSIHEEGIATPLGDNVERVSYRAAGFYLNLLIPPYSPHVKHLEIRSLTSTEMEISSFSWPELRTLAINFRVEFSRDEGSFRYLSSLSIDAFTPMLPGDTSSSSARAATNICRDLALYPECCPALKNLRLEACPEWDILLILIEGRNAPAKLGISPVETLEIPTRCPPILVEDLREVVKGGYTRNNYFNISLAGNYQILRDPSIPGCAECQRALRFCELPTVTVGTNARDISHTEEMEYPDNIMGILESWDTRAEKWYPFEVMLRERRCARVFPLVTISR